MLSTEAGLMGCNLPHKYRNSTNPTLVKQEVITVYRFEIG